MCAVGPDRAGPVVFQRSGRLGQRTGGIDHVIDNNTMVILHITDDIHDLSLVRTRAAFVDYLIHLPELSFVAYPVDTDVGDWQKGWTTFYWAWWIAFAPFVGLFLARISRGRTIREFVLGAMIAPALVCFLWMTALSL